MSKQMQNKSASTISVMAFCGIDVGAKTLVVALQRADQEGFQQRQFSNLASGHKQLIAWLQKSAIKTRVSLEATSTYSLDLALALDAAPNIEVAVLNPKRVHQFAKTLRRSKTDKADAIVLAEYSLRMKFVAWQSPRSSALELKSISRYIAALRQEHTRLGNRLHAARATHTTPLCVIRDLKLTMDRTQRRILLMTRGAITLIRQNAELQAKFESLIGIKGIAQTSAIQLLGELAGLDPSMTVRQWVALSGLDPEHRESGTSVHPRSHISRHGNRHLRRALYMPALSGARFDPHFRAFYQQLQNRQKTKLQALMAVARKLLHAIFGIFKTATPYDGAKLFPNLQLITS